MNCLALNQEGVMAQHAFGYDNPKTKLIRPPVDQFLGVIKLLRCSICRSSRPHLHEGMRQSWLIQHANDAKIR